MGAVSWLVLLAMTASVHGEEDPLVVLQQAQSLARQGRYEEALDRFVWFHDHALRIGPEFTGVRLSFALRYWCELGQAYPPALERLQAICAADGQLLLAGREDRQLFTDHVAISRRLGRAAESLSLFETLADRSPTFAGSLYPSIAEALLDAGRFGLMGRFEESPALVFQTMEAPYKQLRKMEEDDPRLPLAAEPLLRKRFVQASVAYLANQRTADAQGLLDRVRGLIGEEKAMDMRVAAERRMAGRIG